MGILLTVILGGLAGWIASMLMARDGSLGVLGNIVVGVIGAFLANLLLAPFIGATAALDVVTLEGFLMSVLGAVVLLALVNMFTRGRVR